MIQKSKRKYQTQAFSLNVHKRIALKRFWANRLLVCSLGALATSVIGWMFSLNPMLHWIILGLGFLAGFFIPMPSTQPYALSWIRQRIGLSYESALESQPDDYGFHDRLQERAKVQLRQLELPQTQAWWLPIFIAAIAITLLPLIPKTFSALTTTPGISPVPALPTQNETVTPQDTPTSTQNSAPTPPEEADPQPTTSQAQELQGELAEGSGNANRDNQVADEEALSRFLEELQQQQQRNETEGNISPELQPGQPTFGNQNDQDEASRPREQNTNPFEEITQGDPGDQTTEPGQTQSEDQNNQPGQEQNESTQLTETPNSNPESSEPQSQENSMGGAGTQSQEDGQQAMRQEGEGDGTGLLGGEVGQDQIQGLEGQSEQSPELLPGQIAQGPQNVAGTVRLPNTSDETAPLSNTLAPSFRPSDEEALTEGKIPLEYQNIIRNYFKY